MDDVNDKFAKKLTESLIEAVEIEKDELNHRMTFDVSTANLG